MSTPRSLDSTDGGPPLSDDDLARLDEILDALNPDGAMLLEEIDGFFAACVCGPEPVATAELVGPVLGLEADETPTFESPAQRAELESLLERHRASIAQALADGEGFSPILMHDDSGRTGGNLWAIGFLRGISLRPDGWEVIEDDEDLLTLLEPFEALAEELDLETGEVRAPVPDDERQNLIDAMAEAAFQFYERFEGDRARAGAAPTGGPRRH